MLIDILLSHYILTHGGDRRSTKILDLFTFEFKGESPTRYIPLIFTMRADKQNQHSRFKTIRALQNRKPLVYILNGLAFYLLYRQNLSTEPFLDFNRRLAQYNIRLIKSGRDRETALLYNSQRDQVVKALQYIGVFLEKKTHIRRSAGAKTAELKGVSEDQIWRARRQNQEQIVGCYLNFLLQEFIRSITEHPLQIGCFEIRRAGITLLNVLLLIIQPKLDKWKGRFGPQPY